MPIVRSPGRFRTGNLVSFQYGPSRAVARVLEDRGPLGVDGRRVYRIRHLSGSDELVDFEMPDASLEPLTLSASDVVNYLAGGGLIDMLGRNMGGGPTPPRVWLTYSPTGRLTHTFVVENGVVGGGAVPFFVLSGTQVFEPKKGEVISFVRSFGLTQADAEEVIRRVGVA